MPNENGGLGGHFVGPVLVSTSPDAVLFNAGDTAEALTGITNYNPVDHSFEYGGHEYYFSTWEAWMQIDDLGLTCENADEIKEQIITFVSSDLSGDYLLFTTEDYSKGRAEAVKEDALKLIQYASQ